MAIQFFFQDVRIRLAKRKKLKMFLEELLVESKRNLYTLSFIFCTDQYLLKINKDFLGHDTFTDVITFNLAENVTDIQAEIYISADRVRENAVSNGVPVEAELHRVIFHGVLHLCGFSDKTASGKIKMTRAEDACINDYFQK